MEPNAAWTSGGKPLPYVPNAPDAWPVRVPGPSGEDAWSYRPTFEASLRALSPDAREAARIDVTATHGPILMLGGANDALWPSCAFIDDAMNALERAGHVAKYQDEAVCSDAGHRGTAALGASTMGSMWVRQPWGVMALGGTPAATAHAARAADAKVKAFLDRVSK